MNKPQPPSRTAPKCTDPAPEDGLGTISTLSVIVLVGGVAFALVGGRVGHTMGACRSTRLEFERQQKARAEVILEARQSELKVKVSADEPPRESHPQP